MYSLAVIQEPNGVIVYDGPSLLNGERIIVVLTGLEDSSRNKKTGGMIQSYIMLPDQPPTEASANGDDQAVCGNCIHRKVNGVGTCYVNIGQGPYAVWKAYKRGNYPLVSPYEAGERLSGLVMRIGSYGDPCAVPVYVWKSLIQNCAGWTGYTHQWHKKFAKSYRSFLMASCDSERQLSFAQRKGWRTFRTLGSDDEIATGEIWCPADKGKTCSDCLACDGARDNDRRVSIALRAHGAHYKVQRWDAARKAMHQRKRKVMHN